MDGSEQPHRFFLCPASEWLETFVKGCDAAALLKAHLLAQWRVTGRHTLNSLGKRDILLQEPPGPVGPLLCGLRTGTHHS